MLLCPDDNLLSGVGDPTSFFALVLDHFLAEAAGGRLMVRVPPAPAGAPTGSTVGRFHHTPEVFFQLQGMTRFTTPGLTFDLRPGQAAVIPAMTPHEETAMRWSGRAFANVVVMFHRDSLNLHLATAGADQTPVGAVGRLYAPRRLGLIRSYVADAGASDDLLTVCGAMMAAMGHIRRGLARPAVRSAGEHPTVVLCRNIAMTHLSDPDLNVRELARRVGRSPDYLSNLFRRQTGTRLTAWLNARRIEHAARLLRASKLNISEVAWAVGFRDPGYLGRRFKAATGLSCRAYRAEAQGRALTDVEGAPT